MSSESALTHAEVDYRKANIDSSIRQYLTAPSQEHSDELFAGFIMATDTGCKGGTLKAPIVLASPQVTTREHARGGARQTFSRIGRRTDDHYIIVLTDANFAQYRITEADLGRVMNVSSQSQDGVDTHLRGLGDGVVWTPLSFATPGAERPISQPLPASLVDRDKRHFGRAFLVTNSADIPKVLRGFLRTVVDR
ncbi:hypothetical protein EDB85DRAFT_2147586 [Lactarius pseudohatsudake]|nr:hypothetical protein EDB85DRAFT_2147586 [Lactarius pseudohatsudake]